MNMRHDIICGGAVAVTLIGLLGTQTHGNDSDASDRLPAYLSTHTNPEQLLFEDPMTGDWTENWFVDGKEAYLANSDYGLYFASGDYMYPDPDNRTHEQRQKMNASHAVLWTKQEFEGDIIISYDCTRVDMSGYGVNIIYVQAQGIGTEEFPSDIYEWRDYRDVPTMGIYYTYMNALHVSYNVGPHDETWYIRARRYPKNDDIGLGWGMTQLKPDYDDEGAKMMPGKTYTIEVEKTDELLVFRTFDKETKELLKEATWDTTQVPDKMMPKVIKEGRIGFRQMSGKKNIYSNFKVLRR